MSDHIPVLLDSIIDYLIINPDGSYVDCTLGEGGHSLGFLQKLSKKGILIGLDIDEEIHKVAKNRLKGFGQFKPYLSNFNHLSSVLSHFNLDSVDGVFADLGISMFHYKSSPKGFSFHSEDPLDMTLANTRPNAWDVVNSLSVAEISDILKIYGEEPAHYRIATFIDYYRVNIKPIDTTKELSMIIEKAILSKGKESNKKIHRATKSFQAIRIFVNKELDNLKILLDQGLKVLKDGGRFAVLTYHSLEDRLVKQFFLDQEQSFRVKILTKKPIIALDNEIKLNKAARSAKLRVYEKLGKNHEK